MRLRAVFLVLVFLSLNGCGQREKAAGPYEDRQVATVDDYKIVVADFRTAVNPVLEYGKSGESGWVAKEAILDNLITKKLLIIEAQNQGLDRDRAFMKEVERFWEQSLIKLLVRKKGEEFSCRVSVDDDEVRQEYERRRGAGETEGDLESESVGIRSDLLAGKYELLYEEWLESLRKKAAIKVDKDILEKMDLNALRER